MSRKDYVLLAQALKCATPLPSDGEKAMTIWNGTVACVTRALEGENPRFDRGKFLKACGHDLVERGE